MANPDIMKSLWKLYKRNRTNILIVLNTVFICIALLTIVLHLPLLFPASPDLLLKDFIVPIASVIILLFAFFQSRKGNEMQSSLVFYNEEYERTSALIKKIESLGKLQQLKNILNIDFEHNPKSPISGYYILLRQIKKETRVIQAIVNEPKGRNKYNSSISDFYFHISDYYSSMERLFESLKRTVKLHRKGYVVEPHKELLFYKLSPMFKPLVVFSDKIESGEVYNPILPKGFIGFKTEFDLLNIESLKELTREIKALYKQEAYKLEELV